MLTTVGVILIAMKKAGLTIKIKIQLVVHKKKHHHGNR
jgi:hypothetical protein